MIFNDSMVALVWQAHRSIDRAAGAARLRYITDAVGQPIVYLTKLQEARDYLAARALDAGATVPPYIAAEAAAMGSTGFAVAVSVIAAAADWNTTAGPAIEAARIGGKAAVTAAATPVDIEAARVAALAAIELL